MKACLTTEVDVRVSCPHCGVVDSRVDHLFGEKTTFGPWYCDECGRAYKGAVDGHEVDITPLDASQRKVTTLDLLRIDGAAGPIWLVVKGRRFGGPQDGSWYDEHTCPTNWTGAILAVIQAGDDDPHGFAPFVRSVDMPIGFHGDGADVRAIFPECFA